MRKYWGERTSELDFVTPVDLGHVTWLSVRSTVARRITTVIHF
jgi:hypothetical protein